MSLSLGEEQEGGQMKKVGNAIYAAVQGEPNKRGKFTDTVDDLNMLIAKKFIEYNNADGEIKSKLHLEWFDMEMQLKRWEIQQKEEELKENESNPVKKESLQKEIKDLEVKRKEWEIKEVNVKIEVAFNEVPRKDGWIAHLQETLSELKSDKAKLEAAIAPLNAIVKPCRFFFSLKKIKTNYY